MNKKILYRADIDGLRAVAVISVFIFHIDFSWIQGGYTGVDIFFVISGFLITRIITSDIEQGIFSLKCFYTRRIRRILPVFYTVIFATIAVGFVLLLPKDLQSLISSARYALFFIANIYFSKDQGYFDISSDEKPLLHIWSLSIEEQYYFIWPFLLLFFYGISNFLHKKNITSTKIIVVTLTILLVILGVIGTQIVLYKNPNDIRWYFLIQTRFSELMIGSVTALLPFCISRIAARVMAYFGLILILLGFFLLKKESLFPGFNSLIPCLGAAFLIYSGQGENNTNTWIHKLFSLRVITTTGLLSYSLYLWHWPVLAYMRYVYGNYHLPVHWIVQAIALTFMLAFLSYNYIEKNTKSAVLYFRHAFLYFLVTPAIFLFLTTYIFQNLRPIETTTNILDNDGINVCHGKIGDFCVRGDMKKKPSILMVGDSHASRMNKFIDVIGHKEGWSAKILTASSCSPVFDFDEKILPQWAQSPCRELKDFFFKNYKNYDAIFLSSFWAYQLGFRDLRSDNKYFDKLEYTLREISKSVPVYVFSDVPILPIHPFRQLHFSKIGIDVERKPTTESFLANNKIEQLVKKIPNVYWINLSPALSNFNYMSIYNGKPVYSDEHHLNTYGASTLADFFIKEGGKILM